MMRFLNLAILSMLVGCSALVYAQEDRQEEKKPQQEEPKAQPKHDEAKPQPKQDEMKNHGEAKSHQDEAKPAKEEKQEQKLDEKQGDKQEQKGHGEQQARGAGHAGKGGHIPDDKFRAHFGRGHTFSAKTVVVQGQPQFQYGGYNFVLVDAWPEDWAYTDDCYIDYIDGEYFLFDLLHPDVRIAVFVVM